MIRTSDGLFSFTQTLYIDLKWVFIFVQIHSGQKKSWSIFTQDMVFWVMKISKQ